MTKREARLYSWCDKLNKCESLNELAYVRRCFIVEDYDRMKWADKRIIEDTYDDLVALLKLKGDVFRMAQKPAFMR